MTPTGNQADYNFGMDKTKKSYSSIFLTLTLILFLLGVFSKPAAAQEPTPTPSITPIGAHILNAQDLLQLVNSARQSIAHRKLVLDPILMSYTQTEAEMAANSIRGQGVDAVTSVIGMGYGYPEKEDTIFCTSSNVKLSLDDPDPASAIGFGTVGERAVNNVYYRHIGFGIAKGSGDWEGYIFYLLTACYTADNRYNPSLTTTPSKNSTPGQNNTPQAVSQIIIPVQTAVPQPDGRMIHEVLAGQTLWAIAIAYNTHVKDILSVNLLPADYNTIYQGQKLFIPTPPGGYPSPAPTSPPATIVSPVSPSDTPSQHLYPSAIPGETAALVAGEGKALFSRYLVIIEVVIAGSLALLLISILKRR